MSSQLEQQLSCKYTGAADQRGRFQPAALSKASSNTVAMQQSNICDKAVLQQQLASGAGSTWRCAYSLSKAALWHRYILDAGFQRMKSAMKPSYQEHEYCIARRFEFQGCLSGSLTWVAILRADIQRCQIALTSPAHEFADGRAHRGIHDCVDGIVNRVHNEGDDCNTHITMSGQTFVPVDGMWHRKHGV